MSEKQLKKNIGFPCGTTFSFRSWRHRLSRLLYAAVIAAVGVSVFPSCAGAAVSRDSTVETAKNAPEGNTLAKPETAPAGSVASSSASGSGTAGTDKKEITRGSAETPAVPDCESQDSLLLYRSVTGSRISAGGKDFYPVTDGEKAVFASGDFSMKGCPLYCVLYSEGESENSVTRSSVTDIRNIYQEDVILRRYLIAVYSFSQGIPEKGGVPGFTRNSFFMLNGRGAFSSIGKILIDRNNGLAALSAGFVTSEGTYEELAVFDLSGKPVITAIRNTITETTRKEDIDEDGVLDLVKYEKVFVDGSGSETFITWLKFDGRKFSPVKTVNTVQDLRLFLERTEKYLEARETEQFIVNSVSPPVLRKLKSAGLSSEKIMQRIFQPAKRDSSSFTEINTLLSSRKMIDFVFPEILESPFRMESDRLYSFTTYVRVKLRGEYQEITDAAVIQPGSSPDFRQPGEKLPGNEGSETGEEEIYLVRLYMASNPFSGRRFSFFVN